MTKLDLDEIVYEDFECKVCKQRPKEYHVIVDAYNPDVVIDPIIVKAYYGGIAAFKSSFKKRNLLMKNFL